MYCTNKFNSRANLAFFFKTYRMKRSPKLRVLEYVNKFPFPVSFSGFQFSNTGINFYYKE